jgi:glycosyltransferase involved in cell wall biosynthesis
MSYTLVTNFWNESGNFAPFIANIAQQTLQPKHWLFIDDGSMQDNTQEILGAAKEHGLKNVYYFYAEPLKPEGDKTTIGLAWNKALDTLRQLKADYLAVADVDTRFHPDYFGYITAYLDAAHNVGAASGFVQGEKRYQHMPMGGGKVVRWEVFESIKEFWDLEPDTLFNIKSMALGGKNEVLPLTWLAVESRPTTPRSGKDLAYRLHYCGNSWLVALRKRVLGHFLRLRMNGVEQTTDPDARYYYSKRRIIKSLITRRIL